MIGSCCKNAPGGSQQPSSLTAPLEIEPSVTPSFMLPTQIEPFQSKWTILSPPKCFVALSAFLEEMQ